MRNSKFAVPAIAVALMTIVTLLTVSGVPAYSTALSPEPTPEVFSPVTEYTIVTFCGGWGITNYKVYEFPSGSGEFYYGVDYEWDNLWGEWNGRESIEWYDIVRYEYQGEIYYEFDGGTLYRPSCSYLPVVAR